MILAALLACALPTPAPTGLAYLHVTSLDDVCPIVQAASDFPAACPTVPPEGTVCGLDQLEDLNLPFASYRAVASVNGASQYEGGDLGVFAWQADDGTVSRMYADIGPGRGMGSITYPFETPVYHLEQRLGYTEWRDGERVFTADRVFAGMTWRAANWNESDGEGLTIYVHAAFQGVDADGFVACRVIGVHAETGHERDPYDPTWLVANPTVLFDEAARAPDYAGDTAPGADLVDAGTAGPDPGGAAPTITTSVPNFCAGSCGGGGGCD